MISEGQLSSFYRAQDVLVTGGLGMIGSNLTHELVSLGARVRILDNLHPLYGGSEENVRDIRDRLDVQVGDIRDREAVGRAVTGCKVVFNLAAQVSYIDSYDMIYEDLAVNCEGHVNVLCAVRDRAPGCRVIFSGSRMQYGRILRPWPIDESHACSPLTIYGVHKLAGESYHFVFRERAGVQAVSLRLANPYGIRHQRKHSKYGLVNFFIRKAAQGQALEVFGDGSQVRDYIYCSDTARAFLHAGATPEADGEVFNIGSGLGTPFREMAETVVRTVGRGSVVSIPWPANYERIETGDYVADISKARRTLGWEPKVSLEEGVRRIVEFDRALLGL